MQESSLSFRFSFGDRTTSPSTTPPVSARSISGVSVSFIDMHLLHRLFQRRLILLVRLSVLGSIGNGDGGSLETFAGGDDDEGDYGVRIFEESAFRSRVDQRILKTKRDDDDGVVMRVTRRLLTYAPFLIRGLDFRHVEVMPIFILALQRAAVIHQTGITYFFGFLSSS